MNLDKSHRFSSLVNLLNYRAENNSQQIAYTFLERGETEAGCLSYQALDQQARAIAAHLQSLNLLEERALLVYPSGLEFIAAFFGCLYAQVVAVPAYPPRRNQTLARLESIINDAQAKIVLTTSALLNDIERRLGDNPMLKSVKLLATDGIARDLASSWQPVDVSSDTLAFLQYTSGSTGKPKGVMVTHGNLLHNQQMIHKAFGHTQKTIVLGWLPLFHDMGLIGNVLQPLYLGVPCLLMSPVDFLQKPLRWIEAISRFKATTSGGPNSAYELVCQKVKPEQLESLDLSCWQVAFTGAETIRAETLEKFATLFAPCGFRWQAFYPCYGMAETTLMVSGGQKFSAPKIQPVKGSALEQNQIVPAAEEQEGVRRIVGCGQSWLGQKLEIVEPQSLRRCTPAEVGEIWVSGASVAQGYWNREEETRQTFQAYLADPGEGPFLRTGDLGFLRDGELFITGRCKDLIILGGINYYPQDIELTAQKSHEALKPSCGAAFSVEIKGLEGLVIVQEVERIYLNKLDFKQVIDRIRQAITAEYAIQPQAIVLVKPGSIPKTTSGKIQRHACRSQLLDKTLNLVESWYSSLLSSAIS